MRESMPHRTYYQGEPGIESKVYINEDLWTRIYAKKSQEVTVSANIRATIWRISRRLLFQSWYSLRGFTYTTEVEGNHRDYWSPIIQRILEKWLCAREYTPRSWRIKRGTTIYENYNFDIVWEHVYTYGVYIIQDLCDIYLRIDIWNYQHERMC